MPQTNPTHLIAGIQKQYPRIYEVLRMLFSEIQGIKNVIGTGLNSTVRPQNLSVGSRTTFTEVAQGKQGSQTNLTASTVEGLAEVSAHSGNLGNVLKRISVRL